MRSALRKFLLLAWLACAIQAAAASIDAQVRDASGQRVPDAVVDAVPTSGAADVNGARTVAIEQIDLEFLPYVSAVHVADRMKY